MDTSTLKGKLQLLVALTNDAEIQQHVYGIIEAIVAMMREESKLLENNAELPGEKAGFEWRIEDDGVYVTWEEYWRYGGEAHGSFEFPVTWLWDQEASRVSIEKRIKEAQAVNDNWQTIRRNDQQRQERAELERLLTKKEQGEL